MVAAAVAAPYVVAGISALGGLLSSRASKTSVDNTALERGIQMRVADAKKAGIHPLYAMGANIPSPTVVPQTGSGVGDALQAGAKSFQSSQRIQTNKGVAAAQINSLNASAARDQALAAETLSRIKRAQQAANANPTSSRLDDIAIAGGRRVRTDPTAITAEKAEERYGELGEFMGGNITAGADLAANIPESVYDWLVDIQMQSRSMKKRLKRQRTQTRYKPGWPSGRIYKQGFQHGYTPQRP